MTLVRTLSAALALIASSPVYGTQTPRMSFEQIVSESDAIAHGTVVKTWVGWDDARRAIWTHYEIQVADTLKGAPAATLVISEPGGELDGVSMAIAGTPHYQVGEEVVVFAYPTPLGLRRTCGWGQGRFEVVERNGEKTVTPALMKAEVVEAAKGAAPSRALSAFGGTSLQRFEALVREEVARQAR